MSLSQSQDMGLKIASPVGTLVGQLVFGWLADIVGRKRMCMHPIPYFTMCTPTSRTPPPPLLDGVELVIIIVTTVGQAIAGHAHGVSIIGVLIALRFFQGVGIGGDYPLSAVISS